MAERAVVERATERAPLSVPKEAVTTAERLAAAGTAAAETAVAAREAAETAEADLELAAKAGLDVGLVYDIVCGAFTNFFLLLSAMTSAFLFFPPGTFSCTVTSRDGTRPSGPHITFTKLGFWFFQPSEKVIWDKVLFSPSG